MQRIQLLSPYKWALNGYSYLQEQILAELAEIIYLATA